ncbi:hypothetical protein ACIGO9_30010 [Nocardia asteroides]|uniref:hypothetical protein n=1 Tax=Nocardia asteroides TaxID=1824 RepID=UPI0037C857D7
MPTESARFSPAQPSQDENPFPYVTSVLRPDLPTVHLGFWYPTHAAHAAMALRAALHHTAHIEGTTITWSATPEGMAPLSPLPGEASALAELMIQEDERDLPHGHAFPDMFDRLRAQFGYEQARTLYRDAITFADQTTGGSPDPGAAL